ncbi:hypothetical protein BDF14DRAFT_1775039 [Spinellus fusiger]|nr:hypothetical protein BDF14DRAFT_1775039 [Spinellus fusiger]
MSLGWCHISILFDSTCVQEITPGTFFIKAYFFCLCFCSFIYLMERTYQQDPEWTHNVAESLMVRSAPHAPTAGSYSSAPTRVLGPRPFISDENSSSFISPPPTTTAVFNRPDAEHTHSLFHHYNEDTLQQHPAAINSPFTEPPLHPTMATSFQSPSLSKPPLMSFNESITNPPPVFQSAIPAHQPPNELTPGYEVAVAVAAAEIENNSQDKSVPWWTADDDDGFYSLGAVLFLLGFVFPPLWWVGSFWPRRTRELGGKMAERWQHMNRCMSVGFSILLVIAIIVAAVLESQSRS